MSDRSKATFIVLVSPARLGVLVRTAPLTANAAVAAGQGLIICGPGHRLEY